MQLLETLQSLLLNNAKNATQFTMKSGYKVLFKKILQNYENLTQDAGDFIRKTFGTLKKAIVDKSKQNQILNFEALSLVIRLMRSDQKTAIIEAGLGMLQDFVASNWRNSLVIFKLGIPDDLVHILFTRIKGKKILQEDFAKNRLLIDNINQILKTVGLVLGMSHFDIELIYLKLFTDFEFNDPEKAFFFLQEALDLISWKINK